MTKRLLILCALLATTSPIPYVFADDAPPDMPSDSRMKMLPYEESDIYTITTRYGYQSSIVFGRAEEIQTVSVGDRSLWQLIPAGNRLFIRPMGEGVTTNMTILTNKHSYQFDLKSLAEGKTEGNIYVAKFVYQDDQAKHMQGNPMMPLTMPPTYQPRPAVATKHAGQHPDHPNFNYTYGGPDALAPLEAYDDGKTTFVEYVHMPEPPPRAFAVMPDGSESPVAAHIDNHTIVIDTVAPELALEAPAGTIHIYNELLNPK